MARKTINVADVRESANQILAASTTSPDVRLGICSMLEKILMDSGNYKGYRYLGSTEVPEGQDPGIRWIGELICEYPDKSRRFYY